MSMNGITNPAFLTTSEAARDDRFNQVAGLMGTLGRAGALRFVESGTKEAGFSLWVHDYAQPMTARQ